MHVIIKLNMFSMSQNLSTSRAVFCPVGLSISFFRVSIFLKIELHTTGFSVTNPGRSLLISSCDLADLLNFENVSKDLRYGRILSNSSTVRCPCLSPIGISMVARPADEG